MVFLLFFIDFFLFLFGFSDFLLFFLFLLYQLLIGGSHSFFKFLIVYQKLLQFIMSLHQNCIGIIVYLQNKNINNQNSLIVTLILWEMSSSRISTIFDTNSKEDGLVLTFKLFNSPFIFLYFSLIISYSKNYDLPYYFIALSNYFWQSFEIMFSFGHFINAWIIFLFRIFCGGSQ